MSLPHALVKKLLPIPVFSGLTTGEAAEFFEVALEQEVKKGTVLFHEGDDGEALLVVLEGEIQVTKKGVELARLGPQSVLGEMSLVGADDRRSATATALTDLRLLAVPSKRVRKLLKTDNLAALKVLANIAGVLGKRLSLINDKLVASTGAPKKKEELANFGKILTDWTF